MGKSLLTIRGGRLSISLLLNGGMQKYISSGMNNMYIIYMIPTNYSISQLLMEWISHASF